MNQLINILVNKAVSHALEGQDLITAVESGSKIPLTNFIGLASQVASFMGQLDDDAGNAAKDYKYFLTAEQLETLDVNGIGTQFEEFFRNKSHLNLLLSLAFNLLPTSVSGNMIIKLLKEFAVIDNSSPVESQITEIITETIKPTVIKMLPSEAVSQVTSILNNFNQPNKF